MINKEQYEKYIQYRQVIELFAKTGEYVGGCDSLFEYMKVEGCTSCKAAALIEAKQQIDIYERNLQSL